MNLENTERAGARKTLTEEGYLEFNDYSPQQTDDQEENNEEENKKYTVLVIEDDEVMQEFVRGILIKNYRVIQAIDGTEGVEKAREYNPDLIISDIMMKEKDGISLSKELKQDLNTSHIPIILLTALSSEDYQIEGFRKGADEYVTKPFNPELLVTRIQNLIDSRERLREHFRKKVICEPSDVTLTSVDEQFLKRAVEIVEENISDPQFNVPKLIAELGTSRSALYRKLRALVDQSANEFIRSIRLKRAAQLLVQNQLTVSEISYRVGFNDPQYFSKSFKKEFNMTPTNYAYSNKKEDKTSLSDD
jgi:DNA-binding response OmpR family regulator